MKIEILNRILDLLGQQMIVESKSKKMEFVRFGGLSQSEYDTKGDPLFGETHIPPKKYGIFAFPKNKIVISMFFWKYYKTFEKKNQERRKELDKREAEIEKREAEEIKQMPVVAGMPRYNYSDFSEELKNSTTKLRSDIKEFEDEGHDYSFERARKERKDFSYSGYIWVHFVDEAMAFYKGGVEIVGKWAKIHTDDYDEIFKLAKKNKSKELKNPENYNPDARKEMQKKIIYDPYKLTAVPSALKDEKNNSTWFDSIKADKEDLEVFIEKVN